jgi:hypothetical protein
MASIAVVALLVLATTTGIACHHCGNSTERTCPICHLNHQLIEEPLASDRAPVLVPVTPSAEPQESDFTPLPATPRVPGRAPPFA